VGRLALLRLLRGSDDEYCEEAASQDTLSALDQDNTSITRQKTNAPRCLLAGVRPSFCRLLILSFARSPVAWTTGSCVASESSSEACFCPTLPPSLCPRAATLPPPTYPNLFIDTLPL